MAQVTGMTVSEILESISDSVTGGTVDQGSMHLLLTTRSGAVLDAGSVENPDPPPPPPTVANMTKVLYVGSAYPARPTDATYVTWIGPTHPGLQAGLVTVDGDEWLNTA